LKSVNRATESTSGPEPASLVRQGWISLAAWIAFGILVEGLIGFRIPALLDDPIRRDMLRLAHAHGTLLNLALIAAAVCARLELLRLQARTALALRCAVIMLPTGFLLGGVWHFQSDPGLGILLVPVGAVLLLASAVQLAQASARR
jgi:hypothetical protein